MILYYAQEEEQEALYYPSGRGGGSQTGSQADVNQSFQSYNNAVI